MLWEPRGGQPAPPAIQQAPRSPRPLSCYDYIEPSAHSLQGFLTQLCAYPCSSEGAFLKSDCTGLTLWPCTQSRAGLACCREESLAWPPIKGVPRRVWQQGELSICRHALSRTFCLRFGLYPLQQVVQSSPVTHACQSMTSQETVTATNCTSS